MTATNQPPIHVLCVSNDPEIVDRLQRGFESDSHTFNVEIVSNADDGFTFLTDANIDCIVSEYTLPGRDGFDFLRTVRDDLSDLPFILLMDEDSDELVSTAIAEGVTDCMQKGQDVSRYQLLARRISDTVHRHRDQTENRTIFEELPDGITLHGPDGTLLDTNRQFAEMLGYSRSELLGKDFNALHIDEPPYTSTRAEQLVQKAATEGPQTFEWVDETKDGKPLPVEVTLRQTRVNGKDRILAGVRDITNRKKREHELEATRARFQALAENTSHAVVTIDDESIVQYTNDAVEDLFGYTSETLVGESVLEIIPDRFHDAHREAIERYRQEGVKRLDWDWVELPGLHKDGHEISLGISFGETTIEGEHRFTALIRDITERKEREKQLQHRITAMENSMDGIALLDEDGKYTYVNPAHAQIYGYDDPDAFLGESWEMCYTDDRVDEFYEQVFPVLETEGEWRGEAIGSRRDGTSFAQELTLTALDDGGLVCIVRDITERRDQELELKRQTDLLEKTQRMANVGGWELDLRDDELYWTDEVYRIHELPLDDEPELESALEFYHPEDTHLIEDAVEYAIEEGESYDIELRLITANDILRWVRALGEPYYENGEIIMLRGAFQDITEQKKHEERLQELHSITREFLSADTFDQITNKLVSAAHNLLDYPLIAVWEYDADSDRLVPVSASDSAHQFAEKRGLQELPTFEPGSAEMEIFQNDESVLIDDYGTLENRAAPKVPLGAVLILPLGDYGLISIGSFEPAEIDATDRFLGEILASNAEATINRLENEQHLAEREHRLRTIVEHVPLILFAIDQNRELALQVGKGLDQVGLEQNQMVGATVDEMFGDSPVIIEAIERGFEGESVDVTLDLWDRTYQVWYQPIEDDGKVTNVIGVAMDITERQKRERGIRALHEATRETMQETEPEAIAQIAVDTAQNALNLLIAGIWLQDDNRSRLEPVAWSSQAGEMFDEMPVFKPGESISWQVYEEGESRVYDDVAEEPDRHNPETKVRSELIVPLGSHGVLNSGSTVVGQFDETDVLLAELLAANTRSALTQAQRELTLKRQTDRMEFFNAILRHDVSNGMTVIQGYAEFLANELDGDQQRHAETILSWSDDIIELVQRVRQTLDTLTGQRDVQLQPIEVCETLRKEVSRIQKTYPEVTIGTELEEPVHVQANELLGDVLGNIITNAIEHNETEGLEILIAVSEQRDTNTATVHIADNGKGVSDEFKKAIFGRDNTGTSTASGTGFGLFFVDSMVESYGGDVWVEDNDEGGATFIIEFTLAEATTPA